MQLGFNMAGTETAFQWWMSKVCDIFDVETTPFNYVEIGVARGTTLKAVATYLYSWGALFRCFGYDILPSPYFNPADWINEKSRRVGMHLGTEPNWQAGHSAEGQIDILLNQSVSRFRLPIHFALVDGCHGCPCVIRDFSQLEAKVASGGIVAFHDACEEDQGGPANQHCGTGISVREALRTLQLLPESDPCRSEWQFVDEVPGDKNQQGNGFVFVQKL